MEQQEALLTTEPSLQPHSQYFFVCCYFTQKMGVISLKNILATVQFFHMDDKKYYFPQEHIAIWLLHYAVASWLILVKDFICKPSSIRQ